MWLIFGYKYSFPQKKNLSLQFLQVVPSSSILLRQHFVFYYGNKGYTFPEWMDPFPSAIKLYSCNNCNGCLQDMCVNYKLNSTVVFFTNRSRSMNHYQQLTRKKRCVIHHLLMKEFSLSRMTEKLE